MTATRWLASRILTALAGTGVLLVQTPQPAAFDVAVIKLADPGNTRVGMGFGPNGRSVMIDGLTLMQIMRLAYGVFPDQAAVSPSLIPSGSGANSGWIDSLQYDISAKSEGEAAVSKEESNLMLRLLLADRFALRIHRETKDLTVYSLVVGKNGPKLKDGGAAGPYLSGPAPGRLIGTRASMASLVSALARSLKRPVIDDTGLKGQYDFTLEWVPDSLESATANGADPSGASLFTALQDQLGLKLESKKSPMEVIVIDHAERPSPN